MKFYNIILLCVIILILVIFVLQSDNNELSCEEPFKGRNKSIVFDLYNLFENDSFKDTSFEILDVNIIQAKGKNNYENLTSSKNLDGIYVSKKIAYPVSMFKLNKVNKKEGFTVLNGYTQKYDTVGTYAPYDSPQKRMKDYVSDSDDDEDDVESVTYTLYEKLINYYNEMFESSTQTIENMDSETKNQTTLTTLYTTTDEPLSVNQMYISRIGNYSKHLFRLFLNSDKMYYTVYAGKKTDQNIFKKQNDIFGVSALTRGNVLHYNYKLKLLFSSRYGILYINDSGKLMHKKINRKFLRHKKYHKYQIHFTDFLTVNDTMNLYGGQTNIKEIEKRTKKISGSDDSLTHSLSFSNDTYHTLNMRHEFNFNTKVQQGKQILSIIQMVFKDAASLKNYVDSMKGFTVDQKYINKSSYFDKYEGSDATHLIIFNDKSFSLTSLKNWLKNYYSKTDKDLESYHMLGYTF